MTRRLRSITYIIALSTWIVLKGLNVHASEIKIASTGSAVQPQVQLLEWGRGEQGKVLGWMKAPAVKSVPSGNYGLRVAGTDYIHGPIRVGKRKTEVFELAWISVTAPKGSGTTVFFLIDRQTGALAARIPSGAEAIPVLPGQFNLTRDLSNISSAVSLKSGQHLEVQAGALKIATPQGIQDCELYIADQDQRVAAFFRLSQSEQVVLPGTYRVIKRDSGAFSAEIKVVGGERTVLSCAGVSASSMDRQRVPYLVLRRSDQAPIVSGLCDGNSHLVFPGTYLIMSRRYAAEALKKKNTNLLNAAVSFTARKAEHVPLWRTRDDRFFTSHDSQIPVTIEDKHKWLAVGRTYRATVTVAETSTVRLFIRDLETGKQLQELSKFEAKPPRTNISFALPPKIADGATIILEAQARVASGARFEGSSSPRRAVHSRAGGLGEVVVGDTTETTIELNWPPADGKEVAGYNVYRVPTGPLPINGKIPLTGTAFKDIGLSASRKYEYEIRAVDPRGIEGPSSEIVSATTQRP